jgi:hypothetical protein
MVKLFKNGDTMGIMTDCTDESDFTEDFSTALSELISANAYQDDWEFQFRFWLPQYVDICCKMRGYKNNVVEKRLLSAGTCESVECVAVTDQRYGTSLPLVEKEIDKQVSSDLGVSGEVKRK